MTVLPWFEEQEIPILGILTDRGSEYCRKVEYPAYPLYLALEHIDHSKTKVRRPQINGVYERFHRTMNEAFYDIAFRKKIYSSLEELQTNVDESLKSTLILEGIQDDIVMEKCPIKGFKTVKSLALKKIGVVYLKRHQTAYVL
jgi:transposase InsO family protein